MNKSLEDRISFDDELETMEADFSGLALATGQDVDALYDTMEQKISASGHDKWYFLVNYGGCEISPPARAAHSQRGSRLNVAHSLGTIRYDASEKTRQEIAKRPNQVYLGENFFATREGAVAKIAKLRTARPDARKAGNLSPSQYTEADFASRLKFIDDLQIMDVNFDSFSFDNSSDVNGFYDYIEAQVAKTGKKWYFLVNYKDCKITLKAWVSFAQRGKRLNIASSLGSVRYNTLPDTEAEIRARAEQQDFRANIHDSREGALKKIEEMKASKAT